MKARGMVKEQRDHEIVVKVKVAEVFEKRQVGAKQVQKESKSLKRAIYKNERMYLKRA